MDDHGIADITVLVVEDDPLLNASVRKRLEREGMRTEGFSNGTTLLSRGFADADTTLLLLDYSLPDMTGREIIEKLRTAGLEIPFVILTGHDDEQIAFEMIGLGAIDYIVKTQRFQEVVPAKIRRACDEIANRKRLVIAESAARNAASEWQNTFDSIADAVFILDREQRIVRCNKATLRLLGKPENEVVGRYCCTLMHGSDSPIEGCPVELMKRTLAREYGEVTRNGRCFSITADPVFRSTYDLTGAVHVMSDITGRKRMEDALVRSEKRLRAAQALGRIGNWELDLASQKIEWSDEVYRIYHRDRSLGPPTPEEEERYYDEADARLSRKRAMLVIETGKEIRYDLAANLPEGNKVFLSASMSAVRDHDGRVVTLFGTVQDITDRVFAEQALRDSEERFKNLFLHAPIGIALADEKTRFFDVNEAFCRMLGYAKDEMLGMSVTDILIPEEKDRFFTYANEVVLGDRQVYSLERQYRRKDGSVLWVHSTTAGITGPDGKFIYALGMVIDITERKQAEATKTALEEQLRQSQKLEAIGQLAGGVAHDFNNLLGGILGSAELLRDHCGEIPAANRLIARIITSSTKAADHTRQLLTFARKARVDFTHLEIHERIESVIQLLLHSIDRKIEIIRHFTSAPAHVMGDSNMIETALLNIAINARDSMPQGGSITFTTAEKTFTRNITLPGGETVVPGTYISIAVTDTGTGIDKEMLQHIFEPFFTTKAAGKGTGLGLSAVYGCVRQHNGFIAIDSTVGVGSTFTILLPAATETASAEIPEDGAIITGHGNILVVDDEKEVGDTLCEILRKLGYVPTVCCDPLDALDYFGKNRLSIDAVVLDLIMPKMSGLDLFRLFKKLDPLVKVIVASGYSDNNQEKRIMEEGALEFVEKPYMIHEISKALAKVTGRAGNS